MRGWEQLGVLALMVSHVAAQSTRGGASDVRELQVRQVGSDVAVEVTLSRAVTPRIETAVHPDRLVLILPGTFSSAQQKRVAVNVSGVLGVRVGLNNAEPPVTRVVVDLDRPHPYNIELQGNRLILRVRPAENMNARRAPAPAASGAILGNVFRRSSPPPPPPDQRADSSQLPAPPLSLPPIQFPEGQANGPSTTASTSNSKGSAAHPKLGSLQQGTVFPGMGAPGSGTVPPTAKTQESGFDKKPTAQASIVQGTTLQQATPTPQTEGPTSASNTATPPSSATRAIAAQAKPTHNLAEAPSTQAPVAVAAQTAPTTPTAVQPVLSSARVEPPLPASSTAEGSTPSVAESPGLNVPTATPPQSTIATQAATSPGPTATPIVPNSPIATASSIGASEGTDNSPAASQAPPASTQPSSTQATVANPLAGVQLYPTDKPPEEAVIDAPEDANAANVAAAQSSEPSTASDTTAKDVSKAGAPAESNSEVAKAEPAGIPELALRRANPDFRIAFKVKYVASGAAYLDGGRAGGLAEGMKLMVRETPAGTEAAPADGSDPTYVAELEVVSVAENSAVTDIHSPRRDVKNGDLAYLAISEQEAMVQKSALSSTRKYPTVIAFTEGDTLDDEVRAEVPRPPMPSVNRARGRVGLDYMGTVTHGTGGGTSSNLGLVARLDITRLNGTYWNVSGYWRGRLTSSSYTGQQTIQDLINRTYHLSMNYDNPNSAWVAGFGRMYLPWATSLDTIDGGYFGRRLGHGSTLGVFAGSTPDPTSYNYNPDQEIAGAFINFDGGSFDGLKYTSTSGAGVSMLKWNVQKPFVFLENGLFYKRYFSLYDALQIDSPSGNQAVAAPGLGVGRNFLTARFMPHPRVEFNASYNYFRDIPTFDPTLIGTGLLDKYLFQGFSGGVRVEVLKQIWLYTDLGRSNRSGDVTSSLNQLYGITFGQIPWLHMRADAHYSTFNSSFGSGSYEAISLSRNLKESMHFELLGGQQRFSSQYTANNQSKFVTTNLDMNIGLHYFVQGGFTISRGATMNYDQWMFTLGYRFDSRRFKAQ